MKSGLARKLLIKIGQGAGSPLGPSENSEGTLSRMLGRGLAATVVLVLDAFGEPPPMVNVVVTEWAADVLEGSEDFVESDSSGSSDVARLCTFLLWISCSGDMAHLWPSWCGGLWLITRASAGAAAFGGAASACETRQRRTARIMAHGAVGRLFTDGKRQSG